MLLHLHYGRALSNTLSTLPRRLLSKLWNMLPVYVLQSSAARHVCLTEAAVDGEFLFLAITVKLPYLLNQRNHTLKEWETGDEFQSHDTNITVTLTVTPVSCHSFKQNYLLALPWLTNGLQQISYNTSAQCYCLSNISRSTFTGRMLFLIHNWQLQSKAQTIN